MLFGLLQVKTLNCFLVQSISSNLAFKKLFKKLFLLISVRKNKNFNYQSFASFLKNSLWKTFCSHEPDAGFVIPGNRSRLFPLNFSTKYFVRYTFFMIWNNILKEFHELSLCFHFRFNFWNFDDTKSPENISRTKSYVYTKIWTCIQRIAPLMCKIF